MTRPPSAPGARLRWHQRFRRSLRRRLVFGFVLLALGTTAVFLLGSREAFSTGWREIVRPLVADYVDRLAAEIGDPPDRARAEALAHRLPIVVRIDGPQGAWVSGGLQPDDPRVPRLLLRGHGLRDDQWAALFSRRLADGQRLQFGLRWGGADGLRWEDRPRWIGGLTLAGLLVLTLAAFAYVSHLLAPIDRIRAGVLRYAGGDFTRPIDLGRHHHRDELSQLAGDVDRMAEQLAHQLEGQRGLLLAISHELRSPLTRARLNAELVEEGTARDALLRDLAQMRDLIADLLESERLAAGAAALKREPTDVAALLRTLCDETFAGQGLVPELPAALPLLSLDASRLRLALRNLLDNALRHSPDAARPPTLQAELSDGELRLRVRDFGPGVPEADLAKLAQPFYRPDAARSRSAGGVGLGLYLCRLVARSHGGELRLRNAAPGLEAELRLPVG